LSSFFATVLAQPPSKELLVAAASDLIVVQGPLSETWKAQSDFSLRFTFGASGLLARQIASGAPYDVFLSADEARVKELVDSGNLVRETVVRYAQGRLGLWGKGGRVGSLADLISPSILHIAIANPAHAPYGAAARQALEKAGLWPKLSTKIVYGETVRQAYEFAQSGNAEAAIVAWSLVSDRGGILLPANLHSPIRQTGGVVKSSAHPEAARQFLRLLTSAEGRRILQGHGFTK